MQLIMAIVLFLAPFAANSNTDMIISGGGPGHSSPVLPAKGPGSSSKKDHRLAPVVIKMPGFNYKEEFPKKIRGDAWAVCRTLDGYELTAVKVAIKKSYNECTEQKEPEPEVSGCNDYLFLAKGYKGFSPLTFATASVIEKNRGSDKTYEWREQISLNGEVSEFSRGKGADDTMEIILLSGKASHVIDKFEGGYIDINVVWAGDLDGDKKLDLLLQVQNGETYSYRLYLSAYAKEGEVLKLVAEEIFLSC